MVVKAAAYFERWVHTAEAVDPAGLMVVTSDHRGCSGVDEPTAAIELGTSVETKKCHFGKMPTLVFFDDEIRGRNNRKHTKTAMSENTRMRSENELFETASDEEAWCRVECLTSNTTNTKQ